MRSSQVSSNAGGCRMLICGMGIGCAVGSRSTSCVSGGKAEGGLQRCADNARVLLEVWNPKHLL
jgi:hypothetical protein